MSKFSTRRVGEIVSAAIAGHGLHGRTDASATRGRSRSIVTLIAIVGLVAVSCQVVPFVAAARGALAHADGDMGSAGTFVATTGRILDTRPGSQVGPYDTPMSAGTWRTVQVDGEAGVPTSGVSAVLVNFTVVNQAAAGLIHADKDESTPDATVTYMNYLAGSAQSDAGVVSVASDGKIQVYSSQVTDLLIDVQGYYTTATQSGGGFTPVTPTRIVDTRSGVGLPEAALAGGSTSTVQVAGEGGVPAGATAAVVNLTITDSTATSDHYFTAYAEDQSRPATSADFEPARGTTSISQQVGLSTTGSTRGAFNFFLNGSGYSVDLLVDVVGYFVPSASSGGGVFTPAESRVLDTRVAPSTAIPAGGTLVVPVDGVDSLPASGIAAVSMDVAAIDTNTGSNNWLEVWADGTTRPTPSSSLNYDADATTSNFVTSTVGVTGAIDVFNDSSAAVNVVVDVEGWYTGSTLVSGTVVDTNGEPDPGAAVSLTAWPNPEYLDGLADGATVPTETIATTTADSSGNYALAVDLSALSSTYLTDDGLANLEVDVTTTNGVTQEWSTSAAVPGSDAAVDTPTVAVGGSAPEELNFDASADTVSDTVGANLSQTQTVETVSDSAAGSAVADTPATAADVENSPDAADSPDDYIPPAGCNSWTVHQNYGSETETFLNLYTFSGYADVEEDSGSSHTFGVGINLDNQGWEADGSHTSEVDVSSGAGNDYTNNEQLSNQVNEKEVEQTCWGENHSDTHTDYMIEATTFHAYLTKATHIDNRTWDQNYCNNVSSGHYWKKVGSNQEFSAGLQTPFLSLSAQVSFSKDTTVEWFPAAPGEDLCGSNSLGYATAPFAGGEAVPATGCGGTTDPASMDGDDVSADTNPDC